MPTSATVKKALAAMDTDPSKVLGVTVNGTAITKAKYIRRADADIPRAPAPNWYTDAQEAPQISYAAADASATYLVVALDLDAPYTWFTGLGPILHWIQPGLKAGAGAGGALTSSEPFIANYIGPAPPPGSQPHRYTFYLFAQPAEFDASKFAPAGGKPWPTMQRMRFDVDAWLGKAKLGEPLAANYFMSN